MVSHSQGRTNQARKRLAAVYGLSCQHHGDFTSSDVFVGCMQGGMLLVLLEVPAGHLQHALEMAKEL